MSTASGIELRFVPEPAPEPVALPDDPDAVLRLILDPETRGELYPLYHQLRAVAPVFRAIGTGAPGRVLGPHQLRRGRSRPRGARVR